MSCKHALPLVLLLLLLTGCGRKADPPLEWRTVSCAEGRFSILMPGEPKRDGGKRAITFTVWIASTQTSYAVMYVEFPAIFGQVDMDRGIAETAKREQSEIVMKNDLKIEGGIGREVEIVDKQSMRTSYRMMNIGSAQYLLEVRGKNAYLSDANVQRFFASFKIEK